MNASPSFANHPEPDATHASLEPWSLKEFPHHVESCLRDYFAAQEHLIDPIGSPVNESVSLLRDYVLGGGKRIRPTYAWAGFGAVGGWKDDEYNPAAVLKAVSSLEFIQACALIHDDYIDSSDTRRGNPTIHRSVEASHRSRGWRGSSEHFGASLSILIGDLAMVWADDMFHSSALPPQALARAFEPWRGMRTEVIGGQILDIVNEASGSESVDRAQRVNRFKTAAYTIERPLHIGATLADGTPSQIAALRKYGRDIGIAFQLRDDLLGVFGDPAITGKPAGDDLREGKRTVLIAKAVQRADARGDKEAAQAIREGVGMVESADDIAALATIIRATGAEDDVEALISELTAQGLAHLADAEFEPGAVEALEALADKATARLY